MGEEIYLNTQQVADRLKLCPTTVRRLVKKGTLSPKVTRERHRRFPLKQVQILAALEDRIRYYRDRHAKGLLTLAEVEAWSEDPTNREIRWR